MKTTKRSKMLLSSIAMLLVALVALGSASFAWYYTQTSVTANEAVVSAAKADGLEIRKDSAAYPATASYGDWGTSIALNDGATLNPASMTYAALESNVFAEGGVGTNFTTGTLASGLAEDADLSSFAITRFQVAASGDTTTTAKVKITDVVVPATDTYVAFALYKDGALVGSWTSGSNTTAKVKLSSGNIVANDSDTYSHSGTLTNGTDVTDLTNGAFTVGSKTNPTTFVLIGFADGFDSYCTSAKAYNGDVKISLQFDKQ